MQSVGFPQKTECQSECDSHHKALLLYQPKRIAITGGYHGCHMTIEVFKKSRPDVELIGLDDPYKPGDLCWLETPLNPLGDSRYVRLVTLLISNKSNSSAVT